jgi:hypothetical protein
LDEIKNEKPIHVGGFATIQLPADLTLGTEILYQSMPDNNIVLGMFYLEQQFSWKPGPVDWRAAYWAQNEILAEATPKISFSNIFAGEILRLDLVELPLFQFSVKQRFPRWRMNTTIQYAASTAASNMQEIDFAIGKRFRNHVKLTGLFGRVTADALADPVHLARLELRLFY